MDEPTPPQTFNTNIVRRMWYKDVWYYSVVDVVAVLTESVNPNRYSLGEATAIELHRDRDSQGFGELKRNATDAGTTAGRARKVIEQDLGRPVISAQNYRALKGPAVHPAPTSTSGRKIEDTSGTDEQAKKADEQDGPTQLPLFLDPL
jgi:hypothetical protein